jgi:Fic family protein
LRTESVASSKIEGLEIGGRRLFKAQLAQELALEPRDRGAIEVLNNIEVMKRLVDLATSSELTPELLLESHRMLMRGTKFENIAGKFRKEQNWIGGSEFNPCSAEFVPPPPEMVPALIEDLCEFCGRDDLPAVAQAAIAHSQFETIHPFFDGNGRIGRAIIHVVLKTRGLAPRFVPPVSLVLATRSQDYVAGLTVTRYLGDPADGQATSGANKWVGTFAAAVSRSVDDAKSYEQKVKEIQSGWRSRLGKIRRNSAVELMVEALPSAPVVTVKTASELIGRTQQAVNQALPRLIEAEVLEQTTLGNRNRAFEAKDVIDAFNSLERQLASPTGDTSTGAPTRPVPARR